ncbi:MAG: Stk1 family PASTA domain-containing Ser/Thr kinase [Lachnospiraceae bacterium]|nr:Stk1 family PASTA domain-containing Ser/Thr kinase [Lachnospiraceae bacterium]
MIRKGMFIGDRYEIVDKVGSGGMSDVYKALDHKLNRFVAIKVLKTEFSEDRNFVSKFKVEAQSAAGLTHPNIVNVYDVGEDHNIHYIVMELIDGITLKKYIEKKGQLPVKEAVSIAIQVSQGIEAAHNNHIIHRDIKPQNIMISREGKVKVTDFGIARAASTNTINSNAMGSVHYISPEQARGGYIDEKSDIYSLGITLYELITGKVPFEGDSTVSVALQHINDDIPSPKDAIPDLPISVEKIILKCTQKKPDRRYLKISALIADMKKSLISPNEDFVQISAPPVSNATTVMMTDEEVSMIRSESGSRYGDDEGYEENEEGEEEYENEEGNENEDEDDIFGDSDDIDADNPKMDKVIFIGAILSGIVFIALAVIFFVKSMGGCGGNADDSIETTTQIEGLKSTQTKVPDVIGKSEEEACKMLTEAFIGYKINHENHNTIPKGDVIRLSKDVGTVVDRNTTIDVYISDGAKKNTMPDVIGKDKDEAKTLLESDEYGLVVTFEYQVSDAYEANKVIRTDPEKKTDIYYGDTVTIFVSQGADTSNAVVPDIRNMSQERAKSELESRGLSLRVEGEVYSSTIAAGNIVAQDIKAEKVVPRGTTIGVTVSKGPEPTTPEPTTPEPTTPEPTTPEPTTPEPTTPEPTTPEPTFTANFLSMDASDFGVEKGTNGTITKAVLSYTNSDGQETTETLKLSDYNIDTNFNDDWSLETGKISINKKNVKANSEATIVITLSYPSLNEDGTSTTSTATASTKGVFN